jgi:hypothetical protein
MSSVMAHRVSGCVKKIVLSLSLSLSLWEYVRLIKYVFVFTYFLTCSQHAGTARKALEFTDNSSAIVLPAGLFRYACR